MEWNKKLIWSYDILCNMKKVEKATFQLPKAIVIKQEVRFGKPIIKGTRVAIEDILGLLESGYRVDEIPKQLPTVKLAQVKQALRYTAQILGKEEVLSIEQ